MTAVRNSIFLALVLLAFAAPALAMSAQGCGGDCASCHSITVQEANTILKDIATVTAVKPAPVRGLFEVTLEKDGKSAVGYLDYGKKHLMGGQIFDIASRKVAGATQAPANARAERLDPATLNTEHALLLGNPKGKKRLFVFTDPECPYCAKQHAELEKLVAMEPDLAVYIKLFPLKMHPHAYDKARVILAEMSLELLEKSFAGQPLRAPGAQDSKEPVDRTLRYAEAVGINSTPTLVLSDGRIMVGFKDAKALKELLR